MIQYVAGHAVGNTDTDIPGDEDGDDEIFTAL